MSRKQAYLATVATLRDKAIERGDAYDAAYWAIELETECSLSSAELHKRAMERSKVSKGNAR